MKQGLITTLLVGFIVGILLSSFVSFGWAGVGLFSFLGIILLLLSLMTNERKLTALIAVFLVAISLGMARYEIKDERGDLNQFESAVASKQRTEIQGIVDDESDVRENYTRFIVKSGDARILVYTEHYPEFKYGDEVELNGILKKPSDFSEDFSLVDYLAKDEIYYEMFYPKIEKVGEGKGSTVKRFLFSSKEKYLNALANVIPEPYASFMGGLTVGAKQSMPKDLQEDFRRTGIIHIVVLSGYNITLVADFVMKFFSFLPRVFGISFGVVGIILFAIMTGASATVIRASLMALLVILARATGRIYQITWALFLTGFFMILHNPKILRFDTGFQLSFLATLALIYISPYIEKKIKFITNRFKIREIVSATLATQIFVLPLLLYKMGLFSIVSLPVNLLILVFVPITMFFGFIAGGLGIISTAISIPFGWVSYAFLKYELVVVEIFAKIPFASITISKFPLILMLAMYVGYGWIIWKLNKK